MLGFVRGSWCSVPPTVYSFMLYIHKCCTGGAPLTKILIVLSCLLTLMTSTSSWRSPRKRQNRLWHSIEHVFAFRYLGDMMFAVSLLYQFRVNERHMGTGKYCAFLIFSSLIGYTIQHVYVKYFAVESAPGLYPWVFANMLWYYVDIPSQSSFSIGCVTLSDKSYIYMAAIKIASSLAKSSAVASMSGIVAGCAYLSNIFNCQQLRVPSAVESLLH